jgi:hypothetical protein
VKRALIVLVVLVFLVLSAGLARALGAASAERGAIGELVRVQARGDGPAVLARLDGCGARPACRSRQLRLTRRLRRGGVIRVLNLDPSTRFSLGGLTGVTRVAWTREGGRPVVQCVGVRRTGDVVSGFRVRLTSLSRPIGNERACPGGEET